MNAPSVLDVERALAYIPADERETWVKMGMAVKAELGDAGFDVWDQWSAGAENYNAKAAQGAWKSFNSNGKITAGTLFHEAKAHGWRDNGTHLKPTPPTPEQIAQREAERKAEADALAAKRGAASDKASSIWSAPENENAPADYPYLKWKGIQPHGAKIYRGNITIGGMACNNALMIPMKLKGKISSLQFINSDGQKRFLPYGKKGYYLIGKIAPNVPACIVEGFATGASIHEATGYAVVVAFDAGNLSKTAALLRAKYSDVVIVLCADDDEAGRRGATEAAQALGCLVAMPVFGEGASHE